MFKNNQIENGSSTQSYRYLLSAFVVFVLTLAGVLFFSGNSLTVDLAMLGLSMLVFLYFLGKLANDAKKNSFYWIIGAVVFFPFGSIIAFIRMHDIAVKKRWIKK